MKLKTVLAEYCDPAILSNDEGSKAFQEFLSNLPGRILSVDVDTTKTSKLGFKDGEILYKMGVIVEKDLAFVEFYENAAQGQPSMMLISDRKGKRLIIKGRQVSRTFYLAFSVLNGVVEKQYKVE